MKFQQIIDRIDHFITDRFHLTYDQANVNDILWWVNEWISFRGTNVWVLMMAIVICSVGLNMNSTAVVIGAMLLSPLMWPIIGFGVGVARYDLEMIIKSWRNIILAAAVSLIIATCYFTLSPLDSPTSEIIARTSPTTWDVIIAFCGGIAGIIAITRKEKSLTVIPGVAIATALMPPLCTAGFGIANGMWMFALRALYLFCINGVFIAAATFMMARYIHFPRKSYSQTDSGTPRTVRRWIAIIMIITLIPSVLWAVDIVQQNIVQRNIARFVQVEVSDQWGQIITQQVDYTTRAIALWMVWVWVDPDAVAALNTRLWDYQLSGFTLSVNQWLPSESDFANQVNTVDQLADSLQKIKSLLDQQQQDLASVRTTIWRYPQLSVSVEQLYREMKTIYPQVSAVTTSIVQSSTISRDGVAISTGSVDEIVSSGSSDLVSDASTWAVISWWSWLRLFDTSTWAQDLTIKPRYIFTINLSDALTPGQQQAVREWLQTRLTDVIVEDVIWKE